MLNKSNIKEIIEENNREISEVKIELMKVESDVAKNALQNHLSFLEDNCYRYKLQAKAWEIEV